MRFLQFIFHRWGSTNAIIDLFPITLIQQITTFAFCHLSYTDGIIQSAIIYSVTIL